MAFDFKLADLNRKRKQDYEVLKLNRMKCIKGGQSLDFEGFNFDPNILNANGSLFVPFSSSGAPVSIPGLGDFTFAGFTRIL